ncbi:pentatricopeptide repeat-containing protein [Panicum miliaceum]|uniref:Pentatricopeptide repeat-containing protein n=1 Tax=Panicum miliaceum TaxID=4540 RepID=A0A3L6RU03_PANMI|nr:pentatricopeptide repeat-containing protein [Panicum miliaceum]
MGSSGAPPEPAVAAARKLHHLLRSRDLRPALSYLRTLPSPLTLLPNHALNALLRALAAAGRVRAAASLFRSIPSPTPHSFNSLLAALLRRGRRRAASALLAAFLRSPDASPDVTTLNTLLHGLSTASPRPSAPTLLKFFRFLPETYAFAPDAITYNSLLSALCRAGDLATARNLFDGMRASEGGSKSGAFPNVVTYTAMIRAYCAKGLADEALALVKVMAANGVPPKRITYNTMVQGFCEAGRMELVKEVFEMDSFKPDTCTFNTLMAAHCREGRIEDAIKVFDQMTELHVRCDSASYSMVIRALCESGEFGRAEELVDEILEKEVLKKRERKIRQNVDLSTNLIDVLFKNDLNDRAYKITKRLYDNGYYIKMEKVIAKLCEDKKFIDAAEFTLFSLQKHHALGVAVHSLVLDGLCMDGRAAEAFRLLYELIENGSTSAVAAPRSLVLLHHALEEAGKMKEADFVGKQMRRATARIRQRS